jgi:hypothetical protein
MLPLLAEGDVLCCGRNGVLCCRWASCEAYRMANSDLRLLRQLLLEEGYWVVKCEADKRYRALQADATGQKPSGASVTRSSYVAAANRTSYGTQQQHGAGTHSPSHRQSDQGPFAAGGRPNTASIRTNGTTAAGGGFPPAASMHVQPDTAMV